MMWSIGFSYRNDNEDKDSGSGSISDSDLLYGIGLQWHNTDGIGVRGEWELFKIELEPEVSSDISSLSFSLFKRF